MPKSYETVTKFVTVMSSNTAASFFWTQYVVERSSYLLTVMCVCMFIVMLQMLWRRLAGKV